MDLKLQDKSLIVKLPWKVILFDTLLVVCLTNIFLYWNLYISTPFSKAGFFCNDNSIRLPYKPDTIPMNFLWFYKHGVPAIVILIVELYSMFVVDKNEVCNVYEQNRPLAMRFIIRFFHFFRFHYIGMCIQMTIFIIARHTVGRMRPNYLDRCKPNIGYPNCNTTEYITDYVCTGNRTFEQLESSRQSFFSGHAMISIAVATFITLYLQHRLAKKWLSYVLLLWLQLAIISFSIFICFTRIADNAHHSTDVLSGAFVGFTVTYVFWKHIAKVDQRKII